jgi:hypothetical protein
MREGRQWIHFDAQFPLKFGHDLCERFGPAGELLFIQFLCACKRSYPQGRIHYRTDEELRALLCAHFEFVDNVGAKWSLDEFWRWCGQRKVTRTKTLKTRKYVTATRWNVWEDDRNAKERERKRRSRAELVRGRPQQRLEVGVGRLEVGGVRGEGGAGGEGAVGPMAEKLLSHLEEIQNTQANHRNGDTP